jgi:AraC-like DNA-binding protein
MITTASTAKIQFSHPPKPSLSTVLEKLVADASDAVDGDRNMARMLLQQATQLLQSSNAQLTLRPVAPIALAPWQARRVADYIDDNLAGSLPLHDLAKVARLSVGHFSRAFKGVFGETPHAFIIKQRLERACREMLDSEECLAQIAVSCGFADQAHLARLFRRMMGVSPSEWRRANRAGMPPFGGVISG